MAKSEGGIGIGTIIFGIVMWNLLFGDDDADEDKKPKDTTSKSSIEEKVETVKRTVIELGDDLVVKISDTIENIEKEEKVVAKSQKKEKKTTEKAKKRTTEKAKNDTSDPYGSDDDQYGSYEDKW